MNRFDRVTSILLLLQTRSVVTAGFLAEQFSVTERTIYRDIRTLENAGVPIGSEAGIGYFLGKGYRLPPVSFTLDEAASLLLGERLLVTGLDAESLQDFRQALNKIRAVMDNADSDQLSSLDEDLEVFPSGSHFPLDVAYPQAATEQSDSPDIEQRGTRTQVSASEGDRWLRECRVALVNRQVIDIEYAAHGRDEPSRRSLEPIGLFHYSWHWHLIAWCRLREDYRDFRLDRIQSIQPRSERFTRRSRLTLRQYLEERPGQEMLEEVELLFSPEAARFVEEQRYLFGYIDETRRDDGVSMRFLPPVPDYLARWLLQYTDEVQVIRGDAIRQALQRFSVQLAEHWSDSSAPS